MILRRPRCTRDVRGLTLLETLLASALLAIMAATCLPLIAQAREAVEVPSDTAADIPVADLNHVADQFLANSNAFNIDDLTVLTESMTHLQIPPEFTPHTPIAPVTVELLRASDLDVLHAWLIIRCGDQHVCRWLALPQKSGEETS